MEALIVGILTTLTLIMAGEYDPTAEKGFMLGFVSTSVSNDSLTAIGQPSDNQNSVVSVKNVQTFSPDSTKPLKYNFQAKAYYKHSFEDSKIFIMPQSYWLLVNEKYEFAYSSASSAPFNIEIHHDPGVSIALGYDLYTLAPYGFIGWNSIYFQDSSLGNQQTRTDLLVYGLGVNVYLGYNFMLNAEYVKKQGDMRGFNALPSDLEYNFSSVSLSLAYYWGGNIKSESVRTDDKLITELSSDSAVNLPSNVGRDTRLPNPPTNTTNPNTNTGS